MDTQNVTHFIQKIYNSSLFTLFRLKGIACTDNSEERSAPTRFRSNSVPIPKIEVTLYNDENVSEATANVSGGLSTKTNDQSNTIFDVDIPEICIEGGDEVFQSNGQINMSAEDSLNHIRSSSMRDGLKKKRKSIIHSIEHTNVKNFKTFVRSKILSKSNMALEFENEHTERLGLTRKRTCEGRFQSDSVSINRIAIEIFYNQGLKLFE